MLGDLLVVNTKINKKSYKIRLILKFEFTVKISVSKSIEFLKSQFWGIK
jgi:hypothetical protein